MISTRSLEHLVEGATARRSWTTHLVGSLASVSLRSTPARTTRALHRSGW